MANVSWETYYLLPTRFGALGILNIEEMADRIAAKWNLRGIIQLEKNWAWLLNRKNYQFSLKGHHKWKDLPHLTIVRRKFEITPKGALSISVECLV